MNPETFFYFVLGLLVFSWLCLAALGILWRKYLATYFFHLFIRVIFRIFRRFVLPHLPPQVKSILFDEPHQFHREPNYNPECSVCVREEREEKQRQREIQAWLGGKHG